MLLDIIIPQYNETEEVISNLLNSINNQKNVDFSNVKLTIVNDHSDTLLSEEFLKSFSNLDITFLINEKNTGPGLARQKGVDNTSGDFIMFCDSDDELYDDLSLYTIMNYISEYEPNYLISNIAVEVGPNMLDVRKGKDTLPWMHGKVYKRSFIEENGIRFSLYVRHLEDSYYTMSFLGIIDQKDISYLDYVTYRWKNNLLSLTRKKRKYPYIIEIFDDFYNTPKYIYEYLCSKKSKIRQVYLISSILGKFMVLNSTLFDYPELDDMKNKYIEDLKAYAKSKINIFIIYGKKAVNEIYLKEYKKLNERNELDKIYKNLDDFYIEYLGIKK